MTKAPTLTTCWGGVGRTAESGAGILGSGWRPGGGGVLSLEKGTNCGPTAGEQWLSRPVTAKKGGLSSYHIVG